MQQDRIESIFTRFKGMEEARRPWVSTWQELCDYMYPRKGTFFEQHPADAGDELIYDSTPGHALELLAAALHSLLTNPSSAWFGMQVRRRDLREDEEVKAFLEECRRRMHAVFTSDATGFQTNVHELYLDLPLLGTACMFVEGDTGSVVRFSTRPLSEVYVAESARGTVDAVYRKYEVTACQAFELWGEACSERIRQKLEDKPEDKVAILHAVFPRTDRDPLGIGAKNMPLASLYLEYEGHTLLEESGFHEMPYLVPRWSKAAGDVYGRGPGLTALSDTRVLNRMAMTSLMAAEKMADTPIMVPDDGFLGPVNTGPGGISYYRAGSPDRIESLPVKVDLRATEKMMEQKRKAILTMCLADQLQTLQGPTMTATEVLHRQEEKMRVLGPVLGRLQAEFLSPLITRVFHLMLRAGALPPVPAVLDGIEWQVEFVSPVARAQRSHEVQAFQRILELAGPMLQSNPALMEMFDTDRIVRGSAELFALPPDYLRSPEELAQRQAAAAKAAQMEGVVKEIKTGVAVLKEVSEIKVGDGNVLDMVAKTGLIKALAGMFTGGMGMGRAAAPQDLASLFGEARTPEDLKKLIAACGGSERFEALAANMGLDLSTLPLGKQGGAPKKEPPRTPRKDAVARPVAATVKKDAPAPSADPAAAKAPVPPATAAEKTVPAGTRA